MNLSEHFTAKEFQCQCPCKILNVDQALINKLELLRYFYNDYRKSAKEKPLNITSGCRCPDHNKEVGGKPDSQHITTSKRKCLAADIKCSSDRERFILIGCAYKAGFTGIGVRDDIVHVDLKIGDPRLWTY